MGFLWEMAQEPLEGRSQAISDKTDQGLERTSHPRFGLFQIRKITDKKDLCWLKPSFYVSNDFRHSCELSKVLVWNFYFKHVFQCEDKVNRISRVQTQIMLQ